MVTTPGATPVTLPEEITVAIAVELLAHVPPLILLLKLMKEPTQTAEGPLIVPAEGSGLTVIFADADAVPQPVLTA